MMASPVNATIPAYLSPDDDPEDDILEVIDGHIHSGVKVFYEKYFCSKSRSLAAKKTIRVAGPKLHEYSALQTCNGLLAWLFAFQTAFLSRQSNQYTCLPNPLHKPVLSPEVLVLSSINGRKGEHALADFRVIGEIAQPGPRMYMSELLQLSRLAQAVFARQPTRLFLHDFYICGLVLELWVFDHSGLYNCEGYDISKTPSRLLTVMAGYTLMSDA
jgi:hypothetical protein